MDPRDIVQQVDNLVSQYQGSQTNMRQTYTSSTTFDEEQEEKVTKIRSKEVTIPEARTIVEKVLETPIVPFLWGPPGVGKSTLVADICKTKKWELIDLRLSLLNPVDLMGLPVLDKDREQATWYPPAFLPKFDTKKTGILFLDEINLAPPSVQAAAYQLILDKKVGQYRFPPHWKIVAAGNRETDRANVYKISAPLANRFIHYTIRADWVSWREWARKHVRAEILDFLTLRVAFLMQMPKEGEKAFPSPRTWSFMSSLLDAFNFQEETGVTPEISQTIIGTVGEGVGKEFVAFLQDYKIKTLTRQVEEFIKTGKIDMPKAISMRLALIKSAYGFYKRGMMPKTRFDKFTDLLSGEEKQAIKKFDEQHGTDVEKKLNQNYADNSWGI